MNRWYRFYEFVYAEMIRLGLGSCPIGTTCSPDGWACCSAWGGENDKLEVAMLPHEAWWQQNTTMDLSLWGAGCPSCMPKKGILCLLWPIVPVLTPTGEMMIQLWLSCEALVLAPEKHLDMVQFAWWLMEFVRSRFPILQTEFFVAVQDTFVVEKETAVMMSPVAAMRLLGAGESTGRLFKTLMEAVGTTKSMNDKYRHLPVLPLR